MMPQLPKRLNARIAADQQAIIDKQLAAELSVKNGHFAQATAQYAELIQLLSDLKKPQPMVLADAYRNYAKVNCLLADELTSVDSQKSVLYRKQAVLQLQQALLHYPKDAKQSIKSCHQQLTDITKTTADQSHDQSLLVDIDITKQSAKPILHWRKNLLQRFMVARAEAINEIASAAKAANTAKSLLKI